MEQIWKNLEDPSWWFTGIFFVVLGVILTKLFFNWFPFLWKNLSKFIPKQSRKLQRWHHRRVLIGIKNTRQKEMKINWLIGRFWALFLFTVIYMALITVYFALSKDVTIETSFDSYKFFTLLPLYILMLFVAGHKRTLFKIMAANHRWKRITSKSTRSVQ